MSVDISFNPDLKDREAIAREFQRLLHKNGITELDLKPFFEHYTCAIPTPWLLNHGVHFNFMFPQLQLSPGSITDFVYLTKSSATWWCVLVEFERPDGQLFQDASKTIKTHSDLTRGLDQIRDWKDYLEANAKAFLDQIEPVRVPLERNPVRFRHVLVIGRRAQFEKSAPKLRRYSSLETGEEVANVRVMTYDAVLSEFQNKSKQDYDLLARDGVRFRFRRYFPRRASFGTT
ncbi:Shedu immune nuclease family protein [Bradyrhizobium ottawaense]|uniref:Shedu immune nuclease family protein n=1 Tax=Bradyrhizobium ottawaense TaxID=931866 RepID=UPI003FA05A1F